MTLRRAVCAAVTALAMVSCSAGADPAEVTSGAPPSAPSPGPSPHAARGVPSPPSPVHTPPPPTEPADPLAARVSQALERNRLQGRLAVVVVEDGGAVRVARAGNVPMIPASTQKLIVAAAALARLGEDFRYTTTLSATAAPDANGVVRGDLVVRGSGDPTLASPDFAVVEPDRPHTRLQQLSGLVRLAGIRRITGRVVGDPTAFPHQPQARGWLPRYFDGLDATRVSGLTVNAGRRLDRSGGGVSATAARNPAHEAAAELRRLLRRQGVKVGGVSVASTPAGGAVELGAVQSPPLRRILRYMVTESDNHLADAVFRTIGSVDGDGTWDGARAAVERALAPLGLDWSRTVMADGSGLSRANRVSAVFLASLQERMWRSSLRRQWRPLLAVAGETGTLDSRLTATVAQGRFLGKTGSLRDVRSLVGSVIGAGGPHLAILANDLTDRSHDRVRTVIDLVVRLVAEDTFGCERVQPKAPRTKRKDGRTQRGDDRERRKPPRLVCADLPRAYGTAPRTAS